MSQSPLQTIKSSFESREKLIDQLSGMVDKLHGDSSKDQVKARLGGLSNRKLLRLWKVEQTVRERFGDRDKLVAHILDARKKAGLTADDAFKTKLDGFSKARLLDLTKQKHGEAPKKWTAEHKAKLKARKKKKS